MQPQKYERITDFTEREGDDTDHSALNDEFDAAALTTDQIRANLALIQRDDGALKNGIVTADALDDSAFDAVQASVNEATIEAQEAATSALTSATTANAAKDAAVVAKTQAETARDSSNLNAANAAASAAAALASKNAAAASEASALASKNAAAASETAAAGSAASASGSAATSTAQAGIATTKAGEAAASQAAAAASSGTATTKAAEASASEAAALASKNAAAASQTAAAASAATSTTKAGEASASAAAALASEVAADASEAGALASKNAAATSETNALASKNAAATSEANALTYKNAAQASQTAAAASESGAAGSASSAAASAAAAAASLDNFDDRYLGSKTTAPTLDNDGNALIVGALYYNDGTIVSDNKGMWIYDGATWIKASAASQAILTTYKYIATAGQTTFSGVDSQGLTLGYQPGSVLITMNGPVITIGLDVTATSGNSIVLASGAAVGDEINIYSFATFNIANTYTQAQADALLAGKVSKTGAETIAGVKTFSSQPVFSAGVDLGASGQIKFPASQNASSDANTLDDYEEGTWTPTLAFGGGSAGITYWVQQASYVKIGKVVYLQYRVGLTSKGSATGAANVLGLPFPATGGALNNGYPAATYTFESGGASLPNGLFCIAWNDATMYLRANNGGSAFTNLTNANFTNSSEIWGSIVYTVA